MVVVVAAVAVSVMASKNANVLNGQEQTSNHHRHLCKQHVQVVRYRRAASFKRSSGYDVFSVREKGDPVVLHLDRKLKRNAIRRI